MPETLARLFRHTVAYHKADMLLAKSEGEYRPISAREAYRRVGRLQTELRQAGIEKGDRCALLSENRWEWAVADFAMMAAGIVSVPLYPTLAAEQLHYMLDHSEARVVMVSSVKQLEKIQAIWERLPHLEGVIIFDAYESQDERIVSFGKLIGDAPLSEQERDALEESISRIQPHDLASIIYTSGTTGTPKGVMLSHGNFATNVRDNGYPMDEDEIGLSFLPLSHVAERTADYTYFYNGVTVAYAESIETVAGNILEVRPHTVLGVPRFFEKVHSRVMDKVNSASKLRRKLFHWAVSVGKRTIPYRLEKRPLPFGLRLKHGLANWLVLGKLRKRFGGRLHYFVSGAAPLARHLGEFFYAVGIPVCEAYGLTETSPLITANYPEDMRFGTVGKPIPNVEVKIAEDGEILVRGPNVMQGYYKRDDLTEQTIVDGWLHTGDVGEFDSDGYLKITDRKKDLLKTSGGKYIAPQVIENHLKASDYVSMAVVIAEGRKFPSALIVPDFARLRGYAATKGISDSTDAELVRAEEIVQLLEKEVQQVCEGLAQYEKVKKIAVLEREFSIEKGEVTPTMKVRRKEVQKLYADVIEQLYGSGPDQAVAGTSLG